MDATRRKLLKTATAMMATVLGTKAALPRREKAGFKFTPAGIEVEAEAQTDTARAGTPAVRTEVPGAGGGVTSVKDFGAVGDGVTDDQAAFRAASNALLAASAPLPPHTVTISIGDPCEVTYTKEPLFMTIDDGVMFTTTGSLPDGIEPNTMYYVQPPITDSTFRISATRNWSSYAGDSGWYTGTQDHTPIATSGTQFGVHSMHVYGHKPVTLKIPAGNYVAAPTSALSWSYGGAVKRLIVDAYGASTKFLHLGSSVQTSGSSWNWAATGNQQWIMYGFLEDCDAGDTIIQLTANHISSAPLLPVGSWIMMLGLNVQGQYNQPHGWPPNNWFCEFVQVRGVNTSNGSIDLATPLKYSYRKHWPRLAAGQDVTNDIPSSDLDFNAWFQTGSGFNFPAGGAAMFIGMVYNWDTEIEIRGLHDYTVAGGFGGGMFISARKVVCKDCTFDSRGVQVTASKEVHYENCTWLNNYFTFWEVDKCYDYMSFKNCKLNSLQLQCKTPNPNLWEFENCYIGHFYGTGKNLVVRNSHVNQISLNHHCNTVTLENSVVNNFGESEIYYSQGGVIWRAGFIGNSEWTFANGIFTFPLYKGLGTPFNIFVPGSDYHWDSGIGTGAPPAAIDSFGAPFKCLDIRYDTDDVTTATAVEVYTTLKEIPPSSSVTPYAMVTLDIASPGTVNWTNHGLSVGDRVAFTTTGALPTGVASLVTTLLAGPSYLVHTVNNANQFTIKASAGGAAINFTGSQSGTHTAYGKHFLHIAPHNGKALYIRNCSGAVELENYNGCGGRPYRSYFRRRYSGNIGSSGTTLFYAIYIAQVHGYLEELIVDVIKPYTGATGTYTLSVNGNGYGYSSGFTVDRLAQTINLKVAGKRVITPQDAIGDQTGDNILPYGGWIARAVNINTNVDVWDGNDVLPIVEVTIKTRRTTDTDTNGSFGFTTPKSPTTGATARVLTWMGHDFSPRRRNG